MAVSAGVSTGGDGDPRPTGCLLHSAFGSGSGGRGNSIRGVHAWLNPAGSRPDRTNLTTNYILGLEWSSETREALACANAELLAFRSKIVDARRKLIAHLDVNARLASTGLGSFSEDDEVAFWSALQDFVNAAHSEAIGEPFEIDASMPAGDVENLVHSLKEAVDYSDIIEDDPRFLRTRAHAMRYKDA